MTTETERTLEEIIAARYRDGDSAETLIREAFALGAASRASPEQPERARLYDAEAWDGAMNALGLMRERAEKAESALRASPEEGRLRGLASRALAFARGAEVRSWPPGHRMRSDLIAECRKVLDDLTAAAEEAMRACPPVLTRAHGAAPYRVVADHDGPTVEIPYSVWALIHDAGYAVGVGREAKRMAWKCTCGASNEETLERCLFCSASRPGSICTGSGTIDAAFLPMATGTPVEGTCGVCRRRVPLMHDGTTIAPHGWRHPSPTTTEDEGRPTSTEPPPDPATAHPSCNGYGHCGAAGCPYAPRVPVSPCAPGCGCGGGQPMTCAPAVFKEGERP